VVDGVLVYVDDIKSQFERAKAAGAALLSQIEEGPEGSPLYRVEDLEGHRWMFMQAHGV
jgi:PhnB protein